MSMSGIPILSMDLLYLWFLRGPLRQEYIKKYTVPGLFLVQYFRPVFVCCFDATRNVLEPTLVNT